MGRSGHVKQRIFQGWPKPCNFKVPLKSLRQFQYLEFSFVEVYTQLIGTHQILLDMSVVMCLPKNILNINYHCCYALLHLNLFRPMEFPTKLHTIKSGWSIPYGLRREKTCLQGLADNTGADQPAHPPSLISTFVIHVLERTISKLATCTSKISVF